MDKKITIPAGIALMVVLAVAGMLAIFSYTAATPVQADVVAGSVKYLGSQYFSKTGSVTIEFKTDALIPNGKSITIGFGAASSFTVSSVTGVTVNGTPATAAATNQDLEINLAGDVPFGDVSIVIPSGGVRTPPLGASHIITVTPQDATHGTVAVMFTKEPATSGGMVVGPTAGFVGDYTISFTTNYAIGAGTDIVVDFPGTIMLSAEPVVFLDGTAVADTAVDRVGQEVTITTPATIAVGATVTIEIDGDDDANDDGFVDNPITAPAAGPHDFMVTVGNEAPQTFTYMAAEHDYQVDFDTVPDKPNKSDEVVVKFYAPAGGIPAGAYISIILDEDFQVPDGGISASDVLIDGNVTARPLNAPASSDPVAVADAHPADVTVDDSQIFKPSDNDTADWRIMIKVGDMAAGDAFPGEQGIDPGQPVTVTIAKAAGIKAPTEAGDFKIALAFGFEPDPDDIIATTPLTTDILLTLSSQDGSRGDEIAATAKGISNDGTSDFWIDANANLEIDQGETQLCNDVSATDNVAECTFNITPEFNAGHGGACDGRVAPGLDAGDGCNLIKVRDGTGEPSITDGEDDVFELKSSLALNPSEGNPGDRITVQLQDFDAEGAYVVLVTISSATRHVCDNADSDIRNYCPASARVSDGDATFTIEIPSVSPGTRVLEVTLDDADGTSEDTEIIIGGSSVLATPTTVLPNQTIALRGSGFSGEDDAHITQITLGGDNVFTEDGQGDPVIETDDNGSWNYSAVVPVTPNTADGGELSLRVTDSEQRTGSTVLTIPERSVNISPTEGRIGSTFTITGVNYPVLNSRDDAQEIEVIVDYDNLDDTDVEPDAAGRWQVSMKVPNAAGIPSTNVILVTFKVDSNRDGDINDSDVDEIDDFRHQVPGAAISLSPASGPEGTHVEVTATGFDRFTTLDVDGGLKVGDKQVSVVPNPSTDREGNATFSFLVPGLDSGIQTVTISFNETTASEGFEIVESSGVVGAVTSDVEVALEPLLTEGTLDRVFYFNNATKEWQWHIVDPDFAATNNLTEVVSGAPLWVLVTEDTSAVLNSRTVDFTCAGDDCWNLVTFP